PLRMQCRRSRWQVQCSSAAAGGHARLGAREGGQVMKRLALLVVIVVLLASVSAALAQSPAPPIPKNAPAAMLSLVVTDSKGHHVPSLSKDDVQLSIGGVPVELAKFIERGAGGAPAGEMRRIAVLFDVASLSAGARRQAADALR